MVRHRWVVVICACALLVGCSESSPGAGAIVGTAVEASGAPVLGVGLTLVDLDLVQTSVGAAEVIEIGPGQYATGTVPVAADGSFRLPLPAAAELPAGVLAPADDFLYNVRGVADCDLTADPVDARVSGHWFDDKGTYPGLYGVSAAGLALALVTETPLDPGNVYAHAGRFLVWLYADRPVAIATVGAGCVGNVVVDVALSSGWNVAAWTFDAALDQLVLGDAADAGDAIVTLLPQASTP
ncbi:MAG: hypothetical protein K0A98_13250 [Trueperaceae bacterium]|nr:hypothetical protein [Trueperaceae bacterium]